MTTHTIEEWMELLSSVGGCCVYCGSHDRVERDHVIPLIRGGDDAITNIQPLCRSCNSRKQHYMPGILCLDTATTTGWAFGMPGSEPIFGAQDFHVRDAETGQILSTFHKWLRQIISDTRPGMVVYESPFIPRPGSKMPINMNVLRRLVGMTGFVEIVCFEEKLRCREATTSEIAKFFTGKARWGGREQKKTATMDMCSRYGWDADDDNAADALALWSLAESVVAPRISAARGSGPRGELPLYGKPLSMTSDAVLRRVK